MLGRLSFVVCLLLASTQGLPLEANLLDQEQAQVVLDAKYEIPVEQPQKQFEDVPETVNREAKNIEPQMAVKQEVLEEVLEEQVPEVVKLLYSIDSTLDEEPQARFGFNKFNKFNFGILSGDTIFDQINANLLSRLEALREGVQELIATLEDLTPTTVEPTTEAAETTTA